MSGLSGTPTSTFAGVGFWIHPSTPRALPGRGRQALSQRDPIPYSDSATLQLGGRSYKPYSLPVIVKDADWAALDDLVGTSGLLDTVAGLSVTAALLDSGAPEFYAEGCVLTTLQFDFA
jgi:hypothetical protein